MPKHIKLAPGTTVFAWVNARRKIYKSFYEALVGTESCGAFDGGCLIVAQAFNQVLGGEIVVLTRNDGGADHAALHLNGVLWDWDGPMKPYAFIKRFNRNERADTTGYRRLREEDLPNAARNHALVEELAGLLRQSFSPLEISSGIGEKRAPDTIRSRIGNAKHPEVRACRA